MRGEERFAVLGVFLVVFLFAGIIVGLRNEVSYSPVTLQEGGGLDNSKSFSSYFSNFFDYLISKANQEQTRGYVIFSLIGILVLLAIFILIRLFRKKKLYLSRMENKKSDLLDRGISFVNQLRTKGYDDLVIRQMFLEKGWSEEKISLIMI